MKYERILCISDMHIPYHHRDTFKFIKSIIEKYDPDKFIQIGDELDNHAISFHDHHPELLSPGDELKISIHHVKLLGEIIPKMELIDSNHGSLPYRKMVHNGLPVKYLKSYKEALEAPEGWYWHKDLVLEMSNGQKVYFHHGKTSASMKLSKNMSMCAVQGHYHSKFEIAYWANPLNLFWEMRIGCLADDNTIAMEYNKTTLERPIVGCGIILEGLPKLLPMVLGLNGRWTGIVP